MCTMTVPDRQGDLPGLSSESMRKMQQRQNDDRGSHVKQTRNVKDPDGEENDDDDDDDDFGSDTEIDTKKWSVSVRIKVD